MNIVLFLPKRVIINPYINHKWSLHSQEAEVVTMFTFKRCRVIESGVRNLSSYVYKCIFSFMVSLDTILSLDILCHKTVAYTISERH